MREALAQSGLGLPKSGLVADGKIRRFTPQGRHDNSAWYVFNGDHGAFGDWASGIKETWTDRKAELTDCERRKLTEQIEQGRKQREVEERERHEQAATRTQDIWDKLPIAESSPYLKQKQVQAFGLRCGVKNPETLITPMRDVDGKLWNLQSIDKDGRKLFQQGARKKGCFHLIGADGLASVSMAYVVEGYATGASVHMATGKPVIVAFDAGNLEPVVAALRARCPTIELVIAGDDDRWKPEYSNTGRTKAEAVALKHGCRAAFPIFKNESTKPTDFNDLHVLEGLETLKMQLENETPQNITWPEPLPILENTKAEPYPKDALPDIIRAAVEEVQAFTKAPDSLVAGSALAAVSLAVQPHIEVKRAEKLISPASLFLLTIADSGERKSTCDGFFSFSIREYEREQAEIAKPIQSQFQSDFSAWEAERAGLIEKIKSEKKNGKDTQDYKLRLREHEEKKPSPSRIPKLIRGDETPENLAWALAKEWPSTGIISSEGGFVLGAHGMKSDAIMRNLAQLNVLWDGGNLSIGRKTSESFSVSGVRLTIALQIQEPTLRSFFDQSGDLARGTGFLARFLVAWPETTQGTRFFSEAPESWPSLSAFHNKIKNILETPVNINENGSLSPVEITFTPEAKKAWTAFFNVIEGELKTGGELYDVRDVASKTADNAARLAALFQVFEHGIGSISLDCFERASRITAWHLNEAQRFFGEIALTQDQRNLICLDRWLLSYCHKQGVAEIPRQVIQNRITPSCLRNGDKLTAALKKLSEGGRIRESLDKKKKIILINPALLRGEQC